MVSADYIVGLTDGEGCFYVLIQPPFNKKGGARVQLKFFIKVQAGDKLMLDKVRKAFGCGAVYFQAEKRANHTQCYRYTVASHQDIFGIIIPFFLTHPLQAASKKKSFIAFCRIAKLVKKGAHLTKDGITQIQQLKADMNHRTRVVREIRTLRGNAK